MTDPIRILLVDDSPHFLEAARNFLEYQGSISVVGTATEEEDALTQSQTLQPDIILLDLNLAHNSGLKLIPVLKQSLPGTKIIVLTMMEETSYRAASLEAGADGFVHKSTMSKTLTAAILDAMRSVRTESAPANRNSEAHKGEARLMRLAEHLPDLIYRYEFKPTRGFTYVSPSATVMTGYTPEDHYNDPDLGLKLVHPQDRHLLEAATQGGNDPTSPMVLRWVRRDGSIVWTEQRNVSIFDEAGELTAIEGIARDVTERKRAETALKISEENYRNLVETSDSAVAVVGREGTILYANPASLRIWNDPQLIGKNVSDLFPQELASRYQAVIRHVIDNHVLNLNELKTQVQGQAMWFRVSMSPLKTSEGQVDSLLLNAFDVTGHKQAEKALKTSEHFVRETLDSLRAHIAILDENGEIVAVNRSWREFAQANGGDPAGVSEGANYLAVCDAAQGRDSEEAPEIAACIRAVMRGEQDSCSVEYPCHSPEKERWFVARITKFNGAGPLRIVISHNNISIRKKAEEALRQSEENFRQLFEAESDAILLIENETGRILQANKAACTLYGYTHEELLSKKNFELSAEPEETRKVTRHTPLDANQVITIPLRYHRKKDGTVFPVEITGRFFLHQGRPVHIAAIRDITERKQAEEALKAAEERFRTLIEYSSDEISILSIDGDLIYESPTVSPTLGYRHGEFQGRSILQLVHPDDLERVQNQFAALVQDPNKQARDQFRLRHRDGSWRWVEAVGTNLLAEPSVGGIVINYHDITERKQAEEKLIQSENRYRMATHATEDVIWEWDPHTNEVEWSENAAQVFGYEPGEIERDEAWWDERIHPEDRPRVNTGLEQARMNGDSIWTDEYRFRVKDGSYVHLVDRAFIERDAEGNILRMVGAIADITSRKRAEEALRESEERFRSYIQQANDFIFTLDPAGRITSANQAMCKALDYEETELAGMSALELIAPEHRAETTQTLQRIWAGESISGFEVPIQTREGNAIIVHIRGRSIYRNGQLNETMHIARDVTVQRQAETQLKRRVTELEALYQSGIAFNQTFDQKEIGEKIIEVLSARLDWNNAAVRIRRGDSPEVELLAFSHPSNGQESKEQIRSAVTRVGQGVSGWVIEHGQPLRIDDLGAEPRYIPTYAGVRSGLYVPIQIFDRTIGCISVESERLGAFTEEDERLLATLAVQAAAALENARSYQAALSSAHRLGVLYETGQELVQITQNMEELYTSVHFAVSQLMPAEAFTIVLYNEEQGLLDGVYLFDKAGRWRIEPMPFGTGFTSHVISSGRTILIRDLKETSLDVIHFGTDDSVRSVLAVPLRSGEKVFGAICTQSYQPDAYTGDDRYLLEMLAAQAAIALENARLFRDLQDELSERILAEERIKNQLNRLNALRTIDQAITSTFDMHVSLEIILTQTLNLLSMDAAAILLFAPATNTLQYAAGQGFHSKLPVDLPIKLDQSYAGKAVLERRMIRMPNLAGRPVNPQPGDFVNAEGFAGYHCMPLIVKGHVLGVLEVFDRSVTERDEDWLDFLATLAGQAALAIDNAQLFSASRRELAERKRTQEELLKLNAELEERVASRTVDLSRVNAELEHALRVKDEFLANMSHELRTPLNAIIGLSESLEEQTVGPLNERQGKYIGTIHESGRHLLELINDILDLAKIESGNGSLNREYVDVHAVCQASLRMINQMAQKRNQQITFEADERFEQIFADERRLKQMLVNLLSNAVKFTPENGRITLEARGNWEENTATFTVSDTGIGIEEEDLPRLFTPFVQLDSDLSRRTTGTGLGLSLVAQMARLHGGSVGVESRSGKGSRFHFTLPLESAEDSKVRAARITTGGLGAKLEKGKKKHTILLVEDTEEVVMVIRDFLEFEGFRVEVAKNGIDGLLQAKKIHPDLILMDVQMPDMDGFESTRRLRMEAGFEHTPIIALTALAMSGDRERCLAAGMDEYISKPVNLKAMVKLIHKFLPISNASPVTR
jgi:PAS domain S-box-containing protein